MSASIHALPEAVLGDILALYTCGRGEGRSITLACRQWRRLFYEQRELWSSLTIAVPLRFRAVDVQACECKLALVRRVAPVVADFRIGCVSQGREATFPEAGPDLPRFLEALQSATRLTSLHLTSHSFKHSAGSVWRKVMMQLFMLKSTHTCRPLPPLRCLTRLSQLHELDVGSDCVKAAGQLELLPAAAFPAIKRLTHRSTAGFKNAAAADAGLAWEYSFDTAAHLRRPAADPGRWELACCSMFLSSPDMFLALLEGLAVQPQQLACLRLECTDVLSLDSYLAEADEDSLLAHLAHHAPGLHTLECIDCKHLELRPGPYLQGLRTLVLDGCMLEELPSALAAASRLEELSLQRNQDLVIASTDVDSILSRLPALRLLRLDGRQLAPGAATRLQALAARQQLLHLEVRTDEQGDGGSPHPA